eukprot:m.89264 g.89264  ORF g.89264 m.89264 type:complete len:85 (+) comp12888_c0_seq1:723-977(+)
MLEGVGRIAASLKQSAVTIGDVLDDHNDMLDDLGEGMDGANQRLRHQTRHVEHVNQKAKSGGMCCTIFLLIVAIIVVAVVPFGK